VAEPYFTIHRIWYNFYHDKQAEDEAAANEDESDSDFLESAHQAREFVVHVVHESNKDCKFTHRLTQAALTARVIGKVPRYSILIFAF
jgi:hypothetical protein